ncbi:hypothetical protein COCOBI_05-1770 [Coccomyxa sp. Obi]|nr:hypothetical protein COCOBI_05-1770 [Coccomyxa sp. Obi]
MNLNSKRMQNQPDALLEDLNGHDTENNGPEVRSAVIREGDREAAYVYVDFSGIENSLIPDVGTSVTLRGLDTATPEVETTGGTVLKGEYEDFLGTLMFFARGQRQTNSPSTPADAGPTRGEPPPMEANPEGDPIRHSEAESQREGSMEPETGPDQPQENYQLVSHTEQMLKVHMLNHQPP